MSRYGINYYGLATYGTETPVAYAANNFTATSGALGLQESQYGAITLKWNSPAGDWSKIKLVRNSYGFPVDELDGIALDIKNNGHYEAYKETDPVSFIDRNLARNAFYYYSLFVFERVNYKWLRVGDIIGLSVEDYGYSNNLYSYLPEIYKIASVNEVAGESSNELLSSFLSLFGFELNKYHTLTNLLVNRHDTAKLNGLLLPSLLQELGIEYEPEIGYQQSRILARDAGDLYKVKGTSEGLREFLKAFTGWAVPTVSNVPNPTIDGISVGKNKMLDYNDSSFEESVGHWASNGTATLYCLNSKQVKSFALASNVATLDIGAHQYAIGNHIFVSGSDMPLFNQSVAVHITAVTSTTISFALVGNNKATTNAWNNETGAYPVVSPSPLPWNEPTTPPLYPNKQQGIMAIKNAGTTSGTIKILCGDSSPVTKGIPVVGGTEYTFSVYTTNSSTTRNVTLGIRWYTREQVLIGSEQTGTATASGTGAFSARASVTKTAPATAYYAVPTISVASAAGSASNEYQYFDCAQWEASSAATPFDEARQLHLTLKATRINELLNPHFALTSGTPASPVVNPWTITGAAVTKSIDGKAKQPGTTSWQTVYKTLTSNTVRIETLYTNDFKLGQSVNVYNVGAAFDGEWIITGVGPAAADSSGVITTYAYIEYTITGTNPNVARTSYVDGTVWASGNALKLAATASGAVNVKSWNGATTAQLMPIHYPETPYTFSIYAQKYEYLTGDETVSVSISWYDSTNTLIATNTSSAFTISTFENHWDRPYLTAIAPSNAAYAAVGLEWTAVTGRFLWLDSALFEQSPLVFDFFDGSSGYGDITNYEWEGGLANAARSHYYKNKYAIQNRTSNATFQDKLPLGSTVAIYLSQPKT